MHRSVPPLSEPSGIASDDRLGPTGSPRPAAALRSSPRRAAPTGRGPGRARRPAARQAIRNGALTPRYVVPVSSARRHSVERSGQAGLPSNSTSVDPTARPGDEVVPHHPAGRREPEEPVGRPEVGVERERLEVLEEDAAVAVDDRLRAAPSSPTRTARTAGGRTGRGRRRAARARRAAPTTRRPPGRRRRPRTRCGDRARRRSTGARAARRGSRRWRRPVDRLVAVPVAVDRQQHRRLDLGEPVDDGPGPELGRAGRPGGPERGGRQEADHRLGDVGHVRGDAVAAPDAVAHQARAASRRRRPAAPPPVSSTGSRVCDRATITTSSGRATGHRQRVLGVVHRGSGNQRRRACRVGEGGPRRRGRPDARSGPRPTARTRPARRPTTARRPS